MQRTAPVLARRQAAGGVAALYLAAASLAAIPFFLLVLDYESVADPAAKLAMLVANRGSLYAFNVVAYVAFGLALAVLALALRDRLETGNGIAARLVAGWGIVWSCLLVASGAVNNMGMEYVVGLGARDPAGAASAWQVLEAVANGLGGAGGEALGGPWVLLVGVAGLRAKRLPAALCWVGVVVGALGLVSNVPPLRDAAKLFGIVQIPWLAWLGIVLLRARREATAAEAR